MQEKKTIKCLDHGYLKSVQHWGSDEQIIEAARMSTAKGFKGWGTPEAPGDEKLLRYLWENKHATPFEMAGLTIEVGAPIITFRQWHRHRTQSYNEMSGRYTPLPALDYAPTLARLMGQSGISVVKNKQAGTVVGASALSEERAEEFIADLTEYQQLGQKHYEKALGDGIPKELARLFVTVGRYSRMRASANLRNWLAFLTLRLDPHAQYEIRVYAEAIGQLIEDAFPRAWELFTEGLGHG